MASATNSRTAGQLKPSGLAGLLGLFAALCAVFAACATLVDWHDEATSTRWPVVSAVIERADVVITPRARGGGGGKLWRLSVRARYEVNGKTWIAALNSRGAYTEEDAAQLQSWSARYRSGTRLEIRHDPSQPGRIVPASAEGPFASDRVRTDLILFALAALASAALLQLAKVLQRREARVPPVAGGQNGSLVVGLVSVAVGLMVTGFALARAVYANPLTADSLMAMPAGLIFVFAGSLLGLPPQYASWRNWLATLVVTCFAITFDLVAFAPGERHFTGSIGVGKIGVGLMSGEMTGRIFFGIFAVVLDICAVGMWVGQFRRMFAPAASAPKPVDSTT